MTNTKHTPAPWRAKLSSKTVGKSHIIHDSTDYPNGMFGLCHVFGDTPEQEHANAHLISAAPELLAALIGIIEQNDPQAWMDGKAAIAKATGKE